MARRRKQKTSLLTLLVAAAVALGWGLYQRYFERGARHDTGRVETPAPRRPQTPRAPGAAGANLLLGNPSGATADPARPDDYLLEGPEYALSYNRSRGIPNWVSWRLGPTDLGEVQRQNDFRPDNRLPAGWHRVTPSDYAGSGFDRGHLTPSADRTADANSNSATFLMTNMMPQAPDNNQGPWRVLEEYERELASRGNELYIVAGPFGSGGVGSKGPATTTPNGEVTVPAQTWKVMLVLPEGDDDLSRVNGSTRAIAVVMPNRQGIRERDWREFRVSVDEVERLTGLDFFSGVPAEVQAAFESKVDDR